MTEQWHIVGEPTTLDGGIYTWVATMCAYSEVYKRTWKTFGNVKAQLKATRPYPELPGVQRTFTRNELYVFLRGSGTNRKVRQLMFLPNAHASDKPVDEWWICIHQEEALPMFLEYTKYMKGDYDHLFPVRVRQANKMPFRGNRNNRLYEEDKEGEEMLDY